MKNTALTKVYTEEEIKNIKEKLKNDFGTDTISLDLKLSLLYKRQDVTQLKVKKGDKFAFYTYVYNEDMHADIGWHCIEITYSRLDVVFFKAKTSEKPKKEHWICKDSVFFSRLIPLSVKLSEHDIPDSNLPLINFNKGKNNPFTVNIVKNNGSILKI